MQINYYTITEEAAEECKDGERPGIFQQDSTAEQVLKYLICEEETFK